MSRSITYEIPVRPRAWSRPGLHGKRFYDKQQHDKTSIKLYLAKYHKSSPLFEGPTKVEFMFYMPIPKSIPKRELTYWHSKKPDIDNIEKLLLDAGKGVVWIDDAIICWVEKKKIYDKNPRVIMIVTELHEEKKD